MIEIKRVVSLDDAEKPYKEVWEAKQGASKYFIKLHVVPRSDLPFGYNFVSITGSLCEKTGFAVLLETGYAVMNDVGQSYQVDVGGEDAKGRLNQARRTIIEQVFNATVSKIVVSQFAPPLTL